MIHGRDEVILRHRDKAVSCVLEALDCIRENVVVNRKYYSKRDKFAQISVIN